MIPAKEIVAAAAPTTPAPVDGGSDGGGFVNTGATVEIDLSSEAPEGDGGNGGKDRRSSGESDA